MKFFYTLVSLAIATTSFSQTVQYHATFLDPCSNQTEAILYRLVKDSISYYPKGHTPPYEPCELPDTGTYVLYAGSSKPFDVIHIQKSGLYLDTLERVKYRPSMDEDRR